MYVYLKAAQYSLNDGYPEDALVALKVALGYCPARSFEWSKVMTAIRFARKAVALNKALDNG